MEPKFQTSFIPKKPINSPAGSGISIIHSTNVFSVVATVVFIVTLLTSLGLFAYKYSLTNQIKVADQKILEARDAFEPEKVMDLVDANTRIISARNLLEKHVNVSKILVLLEELTIKKMRFTELNYAVKDNNPTVTISGQVQTYNALAEQQDIFLKNEFIINPAFSNFNLGDNGYISVDFSTQIDPELISYKKSITSTPLN